jgi:hypothetical protein
MTDDIRYFLSPDLAPEHDALDSQVWDEILHALRDQGRAIDAAARTNNSLSFRRRCLLFERAERVAKAEAQKAPEWRPAE